MNNSTHPTRTISNNKFVIMTSLGSALEFYDFIIFVYLANVIAPLFFPATNHINSLLATFGVFSVGYLARPIGGIIFSHFGDLYGRKKIFYLTIMLMAIPSLLIAFLPTYTSIGILAPIMLIILRIIQGLAIGGETPGMITYVFELVNAKHRGRYISFLFAASALSTFIAQGIIILLHFLLSNDVFNQWGWRIPFIFGSLLGIVGGYLRKNLIESKAFIKTEYKIKFANIPLIHLLQHHAFQIIKGIIMIAFISVTMLLLFVYMPIYLTNFRTYMISSMHIQMMIALSLLIFACFIIIFGFYSDVIGRKYLLITGILLMAITLYPLYVILLTQSIGYVLIAMLILSLFFAIIIACYGTFLAEMFPTNIRFSAIAIIYNIGFSFFGGTAPLLSTYLIKITNNPMILSIYMIILAILSLISVILIKLNKQN
ncbi:MAG: MFS transporter [Gammaproteobacteria bacterium]|nr:MAG: MFS transporter [Gammaproteobacteria bacterium]UTW42680.1 MFS transporter [bacterium SCSIO 12844]